MCTNSIIRGGGYQLCSEEIIKDAKQDMEDYKKLKDTATVTIYENYIKELENNKNTLRFINPDTVSCQPKPNNIKNVAIIVNHGSRSAAELMVLWFKQSSKVKIFGEPTAGAVDYLDMLTYTLPITGYTLWVATGKRMLTKENGKYDNIGIKPDVEISDNETDWVEFVKDYYEKVNTKNAEN
jgi:C-terminal processing protease CtpA/Prc